MMNQLRTTFHTHSALPTPADASWESENGKQQKTADKHRTH